MDIDWGNKAPEGATHYGEGDQCAFWVKDLRPGISYQFANIYHDGPTSWMIRLGDPEYPLAPLTARTQAWTGEGLPPVGTVCTCNAKGNPYFERFAGLELEIIMHDVSLSGDPLAIFRWVDPEELEENAGENASYLYHGMTAGSFEPIKTAKQIEAEEREGAIHEMVDHLKRWVTVQDLCGDLYDAGYRKFEIVEGEQPVDAQQRLDQDVLMYGTSFALSNDDGTITRLDPTKIVIRERAFKMSEG